MEISEKIARRGDLELEMDEILHFDGSGASGRLSETLCQMLKAYDASLKEFFAQLDLI